MRPPSKPKTFEEFLSNDWPHLVAEVASNTKLLYIVLAAIVGAAIARTVF